MRNCKSQHPAPFRTYITYSMFMALNFGPVEKFVFYIDKSRLTLTICDG